MNHKLTFILSPVQKLTTNHTSIYNQIPLLEIFLAATTHIHGMILDKEYI
jgi:hypothetical protein